MTRAKKSTKKTAGSKKIAKKARTKTAKKTTKKTTKKAAKKTAAAAADRTRTPRAPRVSPGPSAGRSRRTAPMGRRGGPEEGPGRPPDAAGASAYEAHRERQRDAQAEQSRSGRDIGGVPPVLNPERRDACEHDFRLFCETYYADVFSLAWSDDHLAVIDKIERAVLRGELFAIAMPRGSGKTSLCEAACVWALLFGHADFVALVGATEGHATEMIESIKSDIEHNDTLGEDFPSVCYPVRKLEGINQRAAGQLCKGEPTNIRWRGDMVVLPTIAGSRASGGVVRVAGLTGRIRGMKFKRPDGRAVRPRLVLVDDPQTDDSARSPSQCEQRERILAGAILGLAGPGQRIAGLLTLTVVVPDDLADRMLDRDRHPEWQAERTKMVYAFPAGDDADRMWARYDEIRREGMRTGDGLTRATAYYKRHRRKMDAGAVVAWPARFDPGELSAVQSAMNLRFRDPTAFYAEYQNDPTAGREDSAEDGLTASSVASLVSPYPRGVIPHEAGTVTAFVDVQGDSLWYVVCAWRDDFTGWVVDYGTEPEAPSVYYTLRDVQKRGLRSRVGGRDGPESAWYAGFSRLADRVLARPWPTDAGGEVPVTRCLIDANYAKSRDTIHRFCRESDHRAVLMPAHGRYVGAARGSLMTAARKKGERLGRDWRIPPLASGRVIRHVVFDTNSWKSFVYDRLDAADGSPGAMRLFHHEGNPERHRVFGENVTAERRVRVEARGNVVDEWQPPAPGRDNHFFDGLVGCAVAASMQGVSLFGGEIGSARTRRRVSFAQMQREAKRRSG